MSCIIVVPCFNEETRLKVDAFRQFNDRDRSIRFLFVNDGSTDRTGTVLESLSDWDPTRFAVCNLPINGGKGEAVRSGVRSAIESEPEYVGFWDADLATPLEVIHQFCDVLDDRPDLQVVIGSRVRLLGRSIDRRVTRHISGRIFATAASLALGLPVYDTQCGAKLFRVTPALQHVFATEFTSKWIFDVEILARIVRLDGEWDGERSEAGIYEYPLDCWRDVSGSKLQPIDILRSAWEIAGIYWRNRVRPLRTPSSFAPPSLRQTDALSSVVNGTDTPEISAVDRCP